MADQKTAPQGDIRERVIAEAKARNPDALSASIFVDRRLANGRLFSVNMKRQDGTDFIHYVLFRDNELHSFVTTGAVLDEIVRVAAVERNLINVIFRPDVVSGMIALALTTCIIYLILGKAPQIPEALASGWALVLGFYFGKSTNKL